MDGESKLGLVLVGTLLLVLAELTYFITLDRYIKKKQRKCMFLIIISVFTLIVQNYAENYLTWNVSLPFVRTFFAIYGYSIRPVIILLFFYLINDEQSYRFFWLLAGGNAAIHMTALFSHICFWIDENNCYQGGPLNKCCFVISMFFLSYFIYLTVRKFHMTGKQDMAFPIVNALLVTVSIGMDYFLYGFYGKMPVSYLTIAVVASSLFYYIWLHLQFAAAHENALMAEQRIQIMMSQIQPHFLYNTLATIQSLCRIDPKKAEHVTEEFGVYLRQNLDSLDQPDQIPVLKELGHTKVYTEIEKVRFPYIHVEYDIRDMDFTLPALTIQPLVENAIRHGGWYHKEGLISVTIQKTPDYHEIIIKDNGKGFDPKVKVSSEEPHIGIQNVRERIEKMCGGTMTVDSVLMEGTTVTIRIPVSKNKK